MALRISINFPIFAPLNPSPHHRSATELRFSRWNNANAEEFNRRRRTQQQIETELRRAKRFDAADRIAVAHSDASTSSFKSAGTPSAPSRRSIPGKKSKYSKNPRQSHPAFRRFRDSVQESEGGGDVAEAVRVAEDGVSYVVANAPFEFQYSYTETPKVKPVRLREPPVAPFGPTTMPRPWTGRKPMSKKLLPEFDSFKLPPPHKKGVKPVQSPGPFLPGSGPKYVHSREEILGEPLTKEEIVELVNGCKKTRRQLHIGRDGLTHNMLENIHAHWKRRRVCKIKCLGVCTVDMDNVHQQLEDKTGGKVIYGSGGVIYLFRGRNYNYKTRPRYPLMLWKPTTPVYPRLVQRVPDGLTLEEASEMRKRGRNIMPICKLGKNGVYSKLVENVREAFEACDLVRINCQGMNASDYRKIGGKLKDLVPCVLISFEREHILMWRGREWTSSLPNLIDSPKIEKSNIDFELSSTSDSENEGTAASFLSDSEELTCTSHMSDEDSPKIENFDIDSELSSTSDSEKEGTAASFLSDSKELTCTSPMSDEIIDEGFSIEEDIYTSPFVSDTNDRTGNENSSILDDNVSDQTELSSPWTERVLSLLRVAVDNGAAIVLDDSSLDSDVVFKAAVSLAKSAPRGPVFKGRARKVVVRKSEKPKTEDTKVEDILVMPENKGESENKKNYRRQMVMEGVKEDYLNVVPQGSLRVDELAKLLA